MSEEPTADKGLEYVRVKSHVRGALFGGRPDPLRIGRFSVLTRLGQGGMSIVYAAYDDELDRKVALKLLRPEATKHYAPDRLRREAQALARLSHANVVPVYEVGEHEGRVFVAMEFVRGQTLRQWLGGVPHPWSEVERVLLQAAAGLSAAHQAGIVHRDFKPDNVMVDDAGRVRVLDFGVAAVGPSGLEDTLPTDEHRDARLTHDGALVGTPVYMAPECLSRGPATALSDQYSLCAVCYEALTGRRPHTAGTLEELEASAAKGARFPADVSVPAAVRTALLRGLAPSPEDRFATIDALIHALRPRPRSTWAVPAVGLSLVASVGIVTWAVADDTRACASEGDDFAWSEATKARVHDALAASGTSLSEWDAAATALDAYAERWVEARARSCTLDDDEDVSLQRALCFEWLNGDLAAIVEPLGRGDAAGISELPATVAQLSDPEACLDRRRLAALAETRLHKSAPEPAGLAAGLLSNFEEQPLARFGAGWGPSTDVLAGGQSTGHMEVVRGGHNGGHALHLTGSVDGSRPPLWSGAMVFPGEQHFAPANLQGVDTLTFAGKATPGHYAVMVFTTRTGFEPVVHEVELTSDWQTLDVDLDALVPERYDVNGIFFGRVRPGAFEMWVDDVGFR